jgi:hypothetical protein
MVKIIILSEYSLNPPKELGNGRIKVANGPLYDLKRVQTLVQKKDSFKEWTEKCIKDVYKWFDADMERVIPLITCLRTNDYIDSEWCENGKGAIAACDAYSVRLIEKAPATGQPLQMEYFLKFAISKTGTVLLLVSCHP